MGKEKHQYDHESVSCTVYFALLDISIDFYRISGLHISAKVLTFCISCARRFTFF